MKNTLNICLAVSLAVHAVILTGIPPFFKHKPETNIQKKAIQKKEITVEPERIEKIAHEPKTGAIETAQPKPLPYVEKILDKLLDNKGMPNLQKSYFLDKRAQEIALSEPSEEKLRDNPAYMDYYRLIREKIRNSAYQNYDTEREGEIFASFLILQNGSLQNIQFNPGGPENKTLYKIAQKSIENAAPFPVFPKELQEYQYLRFSVLIYFKNK